MSVDYVNWTLSMNLTDFSLKAGGQQLASGRQAQITGQPNITNSIGWKSLVFSSLDVINGIDGNHGGRHSPALESSERLGYKATIRFVPLAGIKRRQRQDMKFRSDFRPGTSRRIPWLDYAILRIVCQGLQ